MQACSLKGMQLRTEAPRITKEELNALLDDPNTVIIDVRQEGDWQQSARKIKGAVHEDPMNEEESWAGKYPKDKNIVLYCSWPSEHTSARVARELMRLGFTKVAVLKGGWKEWLKADFPTERK